MWLSWMDNRTLFACQTLLALVYAVAFLGMRRMNRHLPGTGFFALGFFSALETRGNRSPFGRLEQPASRAFGVTGEGTASPGKSREDSRLSRPRGPRHKP